MELKRCGRQTCSKLRFDRRKCDQQAQPSIRFVDNTIVPWRNFLRSELGQSSRGKYDSFWRYPNVLKTECRIGGRKPPCQNRVNPSSRFDTLPACDEQTDRRRDTTIYCGKIESRGKSCGGDVNGPSRSARPIEPVSVKPH